MAQFKYLPGSSNHKYGYQTGEVRPEGLVQNQLTGLLDSNSQYIQQARNQAAGAANARGLMNSSIAAGSGQAAAIQAGMPIAQSDAEAYRQQQLFNLQAANQYSLGEMGSDTARANANTSASAQIASAQIRAQTEANQLKFNIDQYGQNMAWDKERYGTDWERQQATNKQAAQNAMWNTFMQQTAGNTDLWGKDANGNPMILPFMKDMVGGMWDTYSNLFDPKQP